MGEKGKGNDFTNRTQFILLGKYHQFDFQIAAANTFRKRQLMIDFFSVLRRCYNGTGHTDHNFKVTDPDAI